MTIYASPDQLIYEATSRARMRKPQATSEASRPARQIAMKALHRQSRSLGNQ